MQGLPKHTFGSTEMRRRSGFIFVSPHLLVEEVACGKASILAMTRHRHLADLSYGMHGVPSYPKRSSKEC